MVERQTVQLTSVKQRSVKQTREAYQLRAHIQQVLTAYGLGPRLVVATSGGEDSCVLLDNLSEIAGGSSDGITVAHVDHQLRSGSSEDADFVAQRATDYGVQFRLHLATPPEHRANLEAWARRERYEFLEQVRVEVGADAILTAHHQSDQAETLLMRLLSGRLKSNARGMAVWDPTRFLLRPMLAVPKAEISRYAEICDIPFVEDPSNNDCMFTRNRIRRDLIPQLQEIYNPNLVPSLAELANRLADDDSLLNQQAAAQYQAANKPTKIIDIKQLPSSLAWRYLRFQAGEEVGEAAELVGYDAFQRVIYCVNTAADKPRVVELGFGVSCRITGAGEISFFLGS